MNEKEAINALLRASAYAQIRINRIRIFNKGILKRRTVEAQLDNGRSVNFLFEELVKMPIEDVIAKLGELE